MLKYLILIALVFLAWFPFVDAKEADDIIQSRIHQNFEVSPNLCIMTVYDDSIAKVPFGYTERVLSDCTATDAVYGVSKSNNTVFLTYFNIIFGIPANTVKRSQ